MTDDGPATGTIKPATAVSLGEAIGLLDPRVQEDGSGVDFASSAVEQWPTFRKAAVKGIKQSQEPANMQLFWSFLAWMVPQQRSRTIQRQILDLAAEAASSEVWGRYFWTAKGERLRLWAVGPYGQETVLDTVAAVRVTTLLLQWSPRPEVAEAWLASASDDFRSKVYGSSSSRDSGLSPRGLEMDAASHLGAGAGGAKVLGKAVLDLTGDVSEVQEPSPSRRKPSPSKARAAPAAATSQLRKEEVLALHKELTALKVERDSLRDQLEALRAQSAEDLPSGTALPSVFFAEVAADFPPVGREEVQGPDGETPLVVKAGDTVEVVGRHAAGWVHVRRSVAQRKEAALDAPPLMPDPKDQGWVPEGLLKATGEIGRGIVTSSTEPGREDEGLLLVKAGTLIKVLAKEDALWLVEVDGCRGFVPGHVVRDASPAEQTGLQVIAPRLERGLSSVSGAGKDGSFARKRTMSLLGKKGFDKLDDEAAEKKEAAPKKSAPPTPPVAAEDKSKGYTFALWAYLASYYSIALNIILGAAGIGWAIRGTDRYPEGRMQDYTSMLALSVSIYSVVFGLAWLAFKLASTWFEKKDGVTLTGTPLRAALLIILSLPLFAAWATALAGVVGLWTGFLALVAANRGEKGTLPKESRMLKGGQIFWSQFTSGAEAAEKDGDLKKKAMRWHPKHILKWWQTQGERGERPKWIIIMLWIGANVTLMVFKYFNTVALLSNSDPLVEKCWVGEGLDPDVDGDPRTVHCDRLLDAYAFWIPIAKVFGQGLNLNCALILLCICQHFLQKINTRAIQGHGLVGRICKLIPTHKNLIFHKGLAATIVVYGFIHTYAHYMAHSYTLVTFSRFGYTGVSVTMSIWVTGAVIIFCIVAMYPVSREYVKRTYFEAFFYTHIIGASTFMLCLLWHGPIFYYFAGIPILLYLFDRYLRWEVTQLAPARLLQVRWRPPVLQLVFDAPWSYRAGQYVWLCCPKLNWYEKHPFTIASAPESELLSLAIKCWPGGWTEQLRDFLAAVCEVEGKRDGFSHTFEGVDWITGQIRRGITTCEDGTPLLQIDGPHAAPAMRYLEFEVVILAAAGIGLTPAASILRSLLQHRWRSSSSIKPHSLYFAWLCACKEAPAFEWFSEELSDSEVAASAHEVCTVPDAGMTIKRHCEMHLFVTRAPATDAPGAQLPPTPSEAKLHGSKDDGKTVQRPFRGPELMKWMSHPATASSEMKDIMPLDPKNRPNQAGHTLTWNGRPDWDALFAHVHQRHTGGRRVKVGVFFCGAPAIGKDLKKTCQKYTTADISFRLLKESF